MQLLPHGERRADHRDRHLRRAERAGERLFTPGLTLVEHDDSYGPRCQRVVGLLTESARAPLDEGDVPGREAGEVGRYTACGRGGRRARRELVIRNLLDVRGHVSAAGVVHGEEVGLLRVRLVVRCDLLEYRRRILDEPVEAEPLNRHPVARVLELVSDVLH